MRAIVRDGLEEHLRHEPMKESRSRIKRLRGVNRPQFRLRLGEHRVFYDVVENRVETVAILEKSGGVGVARARRTEVMKKVALTEIKDQLSKYLRMAERDEIVITRHGRPAGVLIGFASEDEWFDYRLQKDPRFLKRIDRARKSLREGRGTKLEDVEK